MLDNEKTNIAHPYMEGLILLAVLIGILALITAIAAALVVAGLIDLVWATIPGAIMVFQVLILAIVWVVGILRRQQIKEFLDSSRLLICWWYTPEEWRAIQDQHVTEQMEGMMVVAPVALGVLFALVGGLLGGMLGVEEDGIALALVWGLIGLLVGALVGGLLGGTIAGGNYLAYHWTKYFDQQRCVALGPTEILYRRSYFRSNGQTRYFERVDLQEDTSPAQLVIDLCNPKPRGGSEEIWTIPVPRRTVSSLREVLPEMHIGKRRGL